MMLKQFKRLFYFIVKLLLIKSQHGQART